MSKTILYISFLVVVILGMIVTNSLLFLFSIYGLIIIIPLLIIFLKKDLINGLLIFFLLILFNKSIGMIILPELPDISLYRIIWIILIITFSMKIIFKEIDIIPITKIEIMMILFCLVCIISMIKTGNIIKRGHGLMLSEFLSGYAVPFSIFFITKQIVRNENQIKKIFQFFLIIGMYLSVTGIFEHFYVKSLIFPRYIMDPNVGIHWGRARGPFVQAAVNGTILGMIFFINLYMYINFYKKNKLFYANFIIFVPITTILFTYTRAVWIGFIMAIFAVPFFLPKLRKAFYLSIFIIILFIIFSSPYITSEQKIKGRITSMSPIYDRVNLFIASSRMFIEKPIFGFGFNNFRKFSPKYFHKVRGIPFQGVGISSHDTLLSILVELGLAGFIPILLIYFYIFSYSAKLYRQLSFNSFIGKGLVAIFWGASIIFIINILSIEMRWFLFANSLFFLLAGMIVSLYQRALLNKTYEK